MANQRATDGDSGGPKARVGAVVRGKWTIEALLGVGGMAAVYAAAHRNGQRAALKILHADFARDKVICERFLREAYVSNKVNHGATVQVLDDDVTEEGEPFLIMELLEGETVRDAWRKGGRTMAPGRVLQICERVLDCLASCHAIKVIHRDLKPANIFILNDGEIRVLDFGVAQMRDATSERTATGTALGTPAYMSPEQAMGLVDQLDGRADLFSVGAMMHALVTGHRINSGRTEQEALVMAATRPVPSVARIAPQLPIELIKVIDRALAWDRRNRFQDAREMQRALLDLMPSQGVGPLPVRPPPRPHEVVAPPPPELPPELARVAGAPRPPEPTSSAPNAPAHAEPGSVVSAVAGTMSSASEQPSRTFFDPLLGFPADVTPSSHAQAPAPSRVAPVVLEGDPRVVALRDLMKHFDRLFPSVRQLGWDHPATERTLRLAYDAFVEATRAHPELLAWTLRPYSFMSLGHTVWEPSAPFDAIPYNLFACGIRSLRIDPGVTLEELRELFVLLLLDPGRDLPPEDDLAAALWDRALPHVAWETVDAFAEGDAAEREAFYGEADQLEHLARAAAREQVSRLEAQAMVLSTDEAALGKEKDRSPFALDEAMRQRLAPQLGIEREAWAERFVDALVEGYLEAAAHREAPLVLSSLRRSSADLVVAGRLDVAVRIALAVIERLRERVQGADNQAKLAAALTTAMFGGEALEIILRILRADPSGAETFGAVLAWLSPNELATMLAGFRETTSPELRDVLGAYIERQAAGREPSVAQAAVGADPDAGAHLIQLLARVETPAARQALGKLGQQTEDVGVRVEARVQLAPSPEKAERDIAELLESSSAFVRMAALRTAARHEMRGVALHVTRIVSAKTFHELGTDERSQALRTCVVLARERGEALLLDLVKKGGVLTSEEREATRAMTASILGDLSRSRATAAALQELANSRWGVSDEVRAAAVEAAKRIEQRLSEGQQRSATV